MTLRFKALLTPFPGKPVHVEVEKIDVTTVGHLEFTHGEWITLKKLLMMNKNVSVIDYMKEEDTYDTL